MNNKKTVFIIGAGASKEANIPTGQELKQKIANLLNIKFEYGCQQKSGDFYICNALKLYVQQFEENKNDINPYLYAAWHICDAMPQSISIDNFIDTHNDNKKIELCGKLAIVKAILEAERDSLLYIEPPHFDNKIDFKTIETTWYTNFMKLLTENCTKVNLSQRLKSLSLIIFNYDRCIEHFLYYSLKNYYGLTPGEVANLVNEIEIYHPYGVVGSLSWQDNQSVAFGSEISPQNLLKIAQQIKTFSEGTDPQSSEIIAIRNSIENSDHIVFLGFAYHKLNMKLLKLDKSKKIERNLCVGTALGISKSDADIIKSELSGAYQLALKNIFIRNDLNCCSLFEEYKRRLSLV